MRHLPDEARAERTLLARSQAVVESLAGVPCAILVANNRGRYISVNAYATVLTGYSEAQLLKMSVWDLTPGVRLTLARRLWKDFIARGRMRGTFQIRRRGGSILRARYMAIGNVLPGIHVSALISAPERRRTPRAVS